MLLANKSTLTVNLYKRIKGKDETVFSNGSDGVWKGKLSEISVFDYDRPYVYVKSKTQDYPVKLYLCKELTDNETVLKLDRDGEL